MDARIGGPDSRKHLLPTGKRLKPKNRLRPIPGNELQDIIAYIDRKLVNVKEAKYSAEMNGEGWTERGTEGYDSEIKALNGVKRKIKSLIPKKIENGHYVKDKK